MQNKNRAFTLIELLVVVLIIGILAAVAVPQYQKAVLKAKFLELRTVTQRLYEAEKIYKLANGTFTQDISQLDIQPPAGCAPLEGSVSRYYCSGKKIEYGVWKEGGWRATASRGTDDNLPYYYIMLENGEAWCMPKSGNNYGDFLCKDIGGVKVGNSGQYIVR